MNYYKKCLKNINDLSILSLLIFIFALVLPSTVLAEETISLVGRFRGCDYGEMTCCSIVDEGDTIFDFCDDETPEFVFQKVDLDTWHGQLVRMTGIMIDDTTMIASNVELVSDSGASVPVPGGQITNSGSISLVGKLQGCDIGQGVMCCGILDEGGQFFGFCDDETPAYVFDKINLDTWTGRTVRITGTMISQEAMAVSDIQLFSGGVPASAAPPQPAPTPADPSGDSMPLSSSPMSPPTPVLDPGGNAMPVGSSPQGMIPPKNNSGSTMITGVFLGCGLGQGIMCCGIDLGRDGEVYVCDDSTPAAVFDTIDSENWVGRNVRLTGRKDSEEIFIASSIGLM